MKKTITNILHRRAVLLTTAIILTATLTGIVHAQATVVACVGDSNTFGAGLPRNQTYPAQMEEILQRQRPDGQWVVHNFGVNGNTVLRRGDQPYSTTRALAANPDIVIFAFGANATRSPNRGLIDERYVSDYVDLISKFSQLSPVPKMWICLPLAAHSTIWSFSPDLLEYKVVPYIHDVAAITGLPIVDLFSEFKDAPELYQSDGLHPTSEGAALMAETVAAAVLGSMRGFPPDFNGDSTVNIEDLVILIERWGQEEPSLDIAPAPWGDGVVDVQDLEFVMQHWGHDVNDPTLVAHWAMNEAEGMFAADSVGDNDAVVLGGTEWQPDDGQIDGALKLDGVGGYAITGAVLNPADGPFSIITWIKGDTPGQVVISQQFASNWLATDAEGNLMTELKSSDQLAEPLLSEKVITDGQWHRIGFVWDGSNRTLYVDGVVVAEDTQYDLEGSEMGLNIGAGQMTHPGTYFSGLIDDVRIYNRAVHP